MMTALNVALVLTLAGFAFYGAHRLHLVYLAIVHRNHVPKALPMAEENFPIVTVQLPVYNEFYVVERLIRSTAAIDYPRDRFEIQVLDDSTDETCGVVDRCVEELAATGLNISVVRRATRDGFKAGALAAGFKVALGEFVAVFDADFIPPQDFLKRVMPHFADSKTGMIQCRWGFLNESESLLTEVQALSLKAHFGIEHLARARSGRFFNFNGTAGVWRKKTIDDAGGWQGDTLTEDLDLSYRAQMRGWHFVYLDDVECPSELPPTVKAFKTQQYRWMKGMAQVARKLLPELLRSPLPLRVKVEAFFHLLAPLTYTVSLASFLLLLPILLAARADIHDSVQVLYSLSLGLTMAVVAVYYFASESGPRRRNGFVRRFIALIAIGIGNSLNANRAIFEGFFGGATPFVRTPKYGSETMRVKGPVFRYRLRADRTMIAEAALTVYAAVTFAVALQDHRLNTPWAGLFLAGCLFILGAQIRETFHREG